jgi:DNA-binding MarR family transcriptional regulator
MYDSYMNDTSKAQPVELLSLLHTAATAQAAVEAELNAIGLSFAKLLALKVLSEAGESLPLGQLAGRLSCVKSNITQLVDRLETDGLVTRKPDPHDRRTRLAVLTTAGRKACKEGTRVHQETERRLLGKLTKDESRQLASLLGKLRPLPG